MRAAIVTIYGDNYGNKLQNYALQTMLESLGYETNTILVRNDCRLHRMETKRQILSKAAPRYVAMVISSRFKNKYPYKNQRDGILPSVRLGRTEIPEKLNRRRHEAFCAFADRYLHFEDREFVPGDYLYPDEYDVYVCGSDQLWNPTYGHFSSAYFLQFAPRYKRVAFAPSFGLRSVPEEFCPLYRRWLNGIPYLSVREEEGAGIIRDLTGKNVPVMPDPTLCLSAHEWEKIEKKPAGAEEPFVLTYFLGNETNAYRKYIKKYSEGAGAKIINLFDLRESEYYAADPSEFVWLVHHAKAMFTDSYHGTVFSLIFHIPFAVFQRIESGGSGMNSRIDTLLRLTGMEHRRYEILPIEKIDRIGFKRSDAALREKKNEAKEYLRTSFEKIRAGTADQDPDEQVGSTGQIKSHLNNKTGTMTDQSGDESIETAFTGKVRTHREDCSGCTACFHACPVQCIQMKRDGEGFLYPEIDLYRCIHCDICRVVCKTAQTPVELRQELRDKETDCRSFESLNSKQISSRTSDTGKAYIAYVKDRKIRHGSSSGGLFSVIAGNVLSKGGTVYGACFDGDFTVCHKAVTEISELASLRGSKYVQSDPGAVFPEIREKLDRGEVVFFSGTPCQVDGLLAYLGKEYDNLYTQDIICHGVPSPLVWKEYLSMRSKGKKVLSVSFRDKTFGWRYFSMNIETDRGKYIRRLDEDIYLKLFLDNVILRPSCYACHHKNIHRRADFTLADAWENITGLKDDDRGISKLFASSPKAQNILEEVKESVFLREILFEDAVRGQKALTESVLYNQDRELFFALAKDRGIQSVLEDWYRGDILPAAKAKTGYWKYRIARRIRSR